MQPESGDQQPPEAFPSTRWSMVQGGATASPGLAPDAWEELSRQYWRPIHAYLRQCIGKTSDQADDLTQSFFAWMIETGFLRRADPGRGRFRALVKVALRNYVTDRERHQQAARRGGRHSHEAVDHQLADARGTTPDEILDQAWRQQLVHQALAHTEAEFAAGGREHVFAVFRDYFLAPTDEVDYRTLAQRHGITRVDVSNYLSRAKQAYRRHLKAQVLDTVLRPDDLEEELRWLFGPNRT